MPVKIESCTVSHFKATINVKVEPEGLEYDGIFISYQAKPKIGHLLHKTGFVHSDMHTTATLRYQIIVQQILLIFGQNAYLHALISSYTIIYFWKKILPTHIFHPTQLFISFKNLGNSSK